ncbi:DUF6889 family protein [Roseixanthobacter pseudopolyaromaticivorans]
MRPVMAGLCTLKELQDGTYDLCDVALLNDALNIRDENTRRMNEAQKASK